jgi:acylphosphatase
MTKSVRVRVAGKVQGVWFRAWTTEQATGRGLSGWVRNCRDGSVEALFSGPADQVDSMIEAGGAGRSHRPASGRSAGRARLPPAAHRVTRRLTIRQN